MKEVTYVDSVDVRCINLLIAAIEMDYFKRMENYAGYNRRKLLRFINTTWQAEIKCWVGEHRTKESLNEKGFLARHKMKLKIHLPDFSEDID